MTSLRLVLTAAAASLLAPPSASGAAPGGCVCVDFWLCVNGTVNVDGSDLFDPRVKLLSTGPGVDEECKGSQTCCSLPAEVSTPPAVDPWRPWWTHDRTRPGGEALGGEQRPSYPWAATAKPVDTAPQQPVETAPQQPVVTTTTPAPELRAPLVAPGGGCGRRRFPPSIDNKVTSLSGNGDPDRAFYGEAPWMIAILRRNANGHLIFRCGGSLITTSVVLTSAHCIYNLTAPNINVSLGVYDNYLDDHPIPRQSVGVQKIRVHPNFNRRNMVHDIGLLFLEREVSLNPAVDVVCLPTPWDEVIAKDCFVTGWGRSSEDGKSQHILSKVLLELRGKESCQSQLRSSRLGRFFVLHDSFVCAGGTDLRDTCKGDGGGPLTCPSKSDPSQMFQMGVVSWGLGCGDGYPTVSASVPYHLSWISSQILAASYS